MKKDKQKVIDEVWTEEHIRSFLSLEPAAGIDAAFHRLRRAYQSMRIDDFRLFLEMFVEAGMSLEAPGPDAQTLLEEITPHRRAEQFIEALRASGAK